MTLASRKLPQRWEVIAVNSEEFDAIDRLSWGGKGGLTKKQFEEETFQRQQVLLKQFLRGCKQDEENSYLRNCSGYQIRLYVLERRQAILIAHIQLDTDTVH